MAYWLVKSEPMVYSWEQLNREGHTVWDGVRNYAARNHLKSMEEGEQVFFYHSNKGMEIVGIAKVSRSHYQDPGTEDPNWVVVELSPFKTLQRPVSLARIKADSRLVNMALVRLGRLSVQPVTQQEWNVIMELAGEA